MISFLNFHILSIRKRKITMSTKKNNETVTSEKNTLQLIEDFGNLFERFMLFTTPRKILKELDLNWQLILLTLEKEQKNNMDIFQTLLALLRTKLDLIYERNNNTLGASAEILNGDIYYITYGIMASILFQIRFITDTTLGEDISYFDYREYNKSLISQVNGKIGSTSLEKLQKEQKQRIQELQNNYKLQLQNLLELQNKQEFTL